LEIKRWPLQQPGIKSTRTCAKNEFSVKMFPAEHQYRRAVIASYYFWKWADNDLPGKPAEVHAALLRGELHPALQTFNARPLLSRLTEFAEMRRECDEEWDWQEHPRRSPENARFVFVTCPAVNASEATVRCFAAQFLPLDLSGYDEPGGHLIPCLPPKLNGFILGQFPHESVYDITADELPVLLRRIRPGGRNPWGELWNRRHCAVVAIAEGRRYRVEWREVHEISSPGNFTQWRARDAKRLAAFAGQDDTKAMPTEIDPDFLTYADTLKIFQTFTRGETRPAQYNWRKLGKNQLP
jgi:hypothetical protein